MGSDFKSPAAQPDTLAHRTEKMQVSECEDQLEELAAADVSFIHKGLCT